MKSESTIEDPLLRASSSSFCIQESNSPNEASCSHPVTNEASCSHPVTNEPPSYSDPLINEENLAIKKKIMGRSRSASSFLFTNAGVDIPKPSEPPKPSTSFVMLSFLGLFLYAATGVAVYMASGSFSGTTTTFRLVDALYFTIVTLTTIGYGDIVPDSTFTKIFTCAFILVGFGFLSFLVNVIVSCSDTQEAFFFSMMDKNRYTKILGKYMVDEEKRRIKIRAKFYLAFAVVMVCIAIGTVTVHFVEDLNWVDSIHLSITSVTTVGYGDFSLRTLTGRSIVIIWHMVSTLSVVRAFIYLTDYIIHKRKRKITQWVLQKKITLSDLPAADLDNDGSISKSDFVIYKLKQMEKITEIEIREISKRFDSLEHGMYGKITRAGIMGTV